MADDKEIEAQNILDRLMARTEDDMAVHKTEEDTTQPPTKVQKLSDSLMSRAQNDVSSINDDDNNVKSATMIEYWTAMCTQNERQREINRIYQMYMDQNLPNFTYKITKVDLEKKGSFQPNQALTRLVNWMHKFPEAIESLDLPILSSEAQRKLNDTRMGNNKQIVEDVEKSVNKVKRSRDLPQALQDNIMSGATPNTQTVPRQLLEVLVNPNTNSEERETASLQVQEVFAFGDNKTLVDDRKEKVDDIDDQKLSYMELKSSEELFGHTVSDSIYVNVKRFIILNHHIGKDEIPPRSDPVWQDVAALIGDGNKNHFDWWSKKDNRIHPYDQELTVVGGGATLNDCIEVMKDNLEYMTRKCPWMRSDPKLAVSYLPGYLASEKKSKWWFDQINNNKLRRVLTTVTNAIKTSSDKRITHAMRVTKCKNILSILRLEAGLVGDKEEYKKEVYKWLRSDTNIRSDTTLFGNHLIKSFFDWARVTNLTEWKDKNKYNVVNPKHASEMLDEYLENETVKKFEKEMNRLAGATVDFINKARKHLPAISEHYNNKRIDSVYIGEKADRAADHTLKQPSRTVRLPSGKEVEVPSYKELNYQFFHELHHVGPAGRKQKLETKWPNNEVKQPSEYNKEDMKIQGPFMDMESQYYHRLVDLAADEDKFNGKSIRSVLMKDLQGQLSLKYNKNKCIVNSDHTANEDNLSAFDLHHLALLYDLQIGSTVLVTKKVNEPAKIKRHAKSHYDLIENLFPELVITRLIDCRYHSLFHYLLDNDNLMEDLELVFPYKFDKEKMIMKYTGEDDDIDDEGGSEEPLELPSVMKVLNQEWKEASRRKL